MPATKVQPKLIARLGTAVALALGLAAPMASAQYVGRINTQKNEPTLRATAILEYTGPLDHPTASRLVPIAVWNGESYQPGGLYLARPVPLTVEAGTQYVLEESGAPKGFFNVEAASDEGGSWIAIGKYQKPAAAAASNLKPSRVLPKIIGGSSSTPHFAHVPAAGSVAAGRGPSAAKSTTGSTTGSANGASTPPAEPPVMAGRPRLSDRPSSSSNGTSPPSSSGANRSSSAGQSQPQQQAAARPPIMSGRPILRQPSSETADDTANPRETVSRTADPNRPHLAYGKPTDPVELAKEARIESAALTAPSAGVEQMVAVSDAVSRPVHSFVYSWDSPEAETKMEAKVEKIAQGLLAAALKPAMPAPRRIHSRTARRSVRATTKHAAPPVPALTDVRFRAFQLTYGSGATLVFSATAGAGVEARYITLIAQPDFTGAPIVLFKQITSVPELGVLPRMQFIDAADTKGDNRADLIFALSTGRSRQYAIYQVANGTAQEVFVTGGWAADN